MSDYWLVPIGLAIGLYSTLVGAGGGFILVPFLLFAYDYPPPTIIGISLTVAFFNSLSGTVAYARQKLVDYGSGVLFVAATIPGAVLGALATRLVSRHAFSLLFGVGLIAIAVDVFLSPGASGRKARPQMPPRARRLWERTLRGVDGQSYEYAYNRWLGAAINLSVGFVANLMGIGGGILRVPAFVQLLRFPPRVAVPTSQFVLIFTALTGVVVQLASGHLAGMMAQTLMLSAGVIVGAQLGARIASRVPTSLLLRLLSTALVIVGVELIVSTLRG